MPAQAKPRHSPTKWLAFLAFMLTIGLAPSAGGCGGKAEDVCADAEQYVATQCKGANRLYAADACRESPGVRCYSECIVHFEPSCPELSSHLDPNSPVSGFTTCAAACPRK